VKAFAGLLKEGLEGESPEAVLAVPPAFYLGAGLEELLTPLRLRGLEAALLRLQDQVRRGL
jgi:cysteine desulfuration protein SufE